MSQPARADQEGVRDHYVGSLVVPTAADRQRPTNWDGVGPRPAGVTVQDFPGLMQRWQDGKPMTPSSGAKRAF